MTLTYRRDLTRKLTTEELDGNFDHVIDSANQSFVQSGSVASARTVQAKLRDVVHVKDFGVTGDGTTDDTTAFNNARTAALGKTLFITGTPLISSALQISSREHWVFDGAHGNAANGYPGSYLIKKSTLSGALVTIGHATGGEGSVIEGGGIVGQAGNGGDGYHIIVNGVTLVRPYVTAMGQDGIRVGSDSTGINANSFKIYSPVCIANGRHGIYVHDSDAGADPIDANAGLLIDPFCQSNTGDGIKIDKALANTIVNPSCETNTGAGLHFGAGAVANMVYGGDLNEGNSGTDFVTTSGATNNALYGTEYGTISDAGTGTIILGRSQNKIINGIALGNTANAGVTVLDHYLEGTFTPTLSFGGGSTGLTYSTQYGRYTRIGDVIIAYITIILTAKGSSTGNAQIGGLPVTAANVSFNSGATFSQATNMTGLGGTMVAQVAANSTAINLSQWGATGTAAITHAVFTDTSNIQLVAVYPA